MTTLRTMFWKSTGLMLLLAALAGKAEAGAGPPPPACVPEIDPGSALSAFTLVSGGLMILKDRRRSK